MRRNIAIIITGLFCFAIAVSMVYEDADGAESKEVTTQDTQVVEEISTGYELPLAGVSIYLSQRISDSLEVAEKADPECEDTDIEYFNDGFRYYDIPQNFKDEGGEFTEDVQRYLWDLCKEKDLNYYLVVAMIERESGYRADCLGDDGNSLGYMQIFQKYHTERMKEENVTDLYDPYGNLRVGTTFLQELFRDYGNSGDNCVLMVYNMGAGGAKNLWKQGIYSSEYSRGITQRAQEIEQELTQD